MSVTLPAPLDAYVEAANARDGDAYLALFTDDAVVEDERQEHRGIDAIRAWRDRSEQAYTYTMDPKEVVERGGVTVLTAELEGDFPGSPLDLHYEFTLRDGRIAGLRIHP